MASGEIPRFGALLKRLRLAAGLTHEALAEQAGLSARAISDLERGVARAPRRETLALLTSALALNEAERTLLEAAARDPGSAEPPTRPHNLPAQLTSFVGRDREVRALRGYLRRPGTRLVTLTGAGGVGKTRLALRTADTLLDAFPDGAFLVPLAPVADASTVVQSVAQALGVGASAGPALEETLVDRLRGRRLLLLLDSFEHLLTGTPLLARLLAACPGVTALVTSRAALRLSGEQELPVGPLPVPDPAQAWSLDALAACPSVSLFVERASRVRPDFRLGPDNAGLVATICTRLDGLPLALELAAARVKLLGPRALLDRLAAPGGSAMRLLTNGPADLPERHRTLRSTIAWSYDLLPTGEQRLFRRLAVFVGGFDVEGAAAIGGGSTELDDPDVDLLDGLGSLLDKSLLRREEAPDGEPRLAMLDTIREFALELLAGSDEETTVRARHARHFLAMVEATGPVLLGTARARQRLAAERDNIRLALRWLVERG